ncbi:hypothetical protein JHK82_055189 [Glycine max]|nr:hypothetical protein JHK86_055029 [Glycine max]KAG5073819.1 hypothetical protein JHK84_055050 [Glycine max]KAG5076494.1 hypothetical protein JHK82_055189 [Glycine max]
MDIRITLERTSLIDYWDCRCTNSIMTSDVWQELQEEHTIIELHARLGNRFDVHVGGRALSTVTNYMVYMVEVNIIERCYILSLIESVKAYFPPFCGFCKRIFEVYP